MHRRILFDFAVGLALITAGALLPTGCTASDYGPMEVLALILLLGMFVSAVRLGRGNAADKPETPPVRDEPPVSGGQEVAHPYCSECARYRVIRLLREQGRIRRRDRPCTAG